MTIFSSPFLPVSNCRGVTISENPYNVFQVGLILQVMCLFRLPHYTVPLLPE